MNYKDAIGGMIMLILVYLLVANSDKTSKVISTLGSQLTKQTEALQGR